jgi:thiamine biosynthesis lipoprotein
MGSVASLVVGSDAPVEAVDRVRAWFDEVEAALSPFRPDSDLCRWRSGAAALEACSPLLSQVVSDVEDLRRATLGGFHPWDATGRFDPTGYVKGWAIERGVQVLGEAGVADACLGIGGDLQLIGQASPRRAWRVGVSDPADPRRLLAMVSRPAEGGAGPWAVATSGNAERGDHIWAPGPPLRSLSSSRLHSVTVVGPRLGRADAFATAIWALALQGPLDRAWAWLAGTGYEALAVDGAGVVRGTPGMRAHVVAPAA